ADAEEEAVGDERHGTLVPSCPGSAGARTAREAPPREPPRRVRRKKKQAEPARQCAPRRSLGARAGGACQTVRAEAEPGREGVRTASRRRDRRTIVRHPRGRWPARAS